MADIRSSANAVGLTQLMPSTARQYARNAEGEIRLERSPDESGVERSDRPVLSSEKIKRIRSAVSCAGELQRGRAARASAGCRSGRAFPLKSSSTTFRYLQTQNYVKKILGTADDYRRSVLLGRVAMRRQSEALAEGANPLLQHRSPLPRNCAQADDHEKPAGRSKIQQPRMPGTRKTSLRVSGRSTCRTHRIDKGDAVH